MYMHKNSTNKNKQVLYTGMKQYPLLITCKKAGDYLYNKEDIDMHGNLVTESNITECNRMSLTILTQKSMSQALQEEWTGLCQVQLVQSMCQRCLECVQAQERCTYY